jgi:5'-methylthioadenosine phosphorylase
MDISDKGASMPPKSAARKKVKKRSSLLRAEIGILGGTGLYEIDGLDGLKEYTLKTPFGDPSDAFMVGTLAGRRVAFLSRHGRGHRFLPTQVNYRANIYGFKMLGVERIISVNSVGSLKEEIHPRDIVFADQFFDRTRRPSTFFGDGVATHITFADPICPQLSKFLFDTATALGIRAHLGGTYICIEGPAFSSKAESRVYRSWGCDVIGMTSLTEAKLCREAEICYVTMCLVTDYDVWHAEEEHVSVELILENLRLNIDNARAIMKTAVRAIGPQEESECDCRSALKNAIVTNPKLIPAASKRKLGLLIKKYIK